LDIVTRTVCRPCHDVLTSLEDWALRSLGDLIDGSTQRIRASEHAQRYAASWAVKTLMTIDLCLPDPVIPRKQREAFFRDRGPLGESLVWWAHYSSDNPGCRVRRRSLVLAGPDEPRLAVYAALRIGHLAFVLALKLHRQPLHLLRLAVDDEGLGRIWPPETPFAEWPPLGRPLTDARFEALSQADFLLAPSPPPAP
jgi:hypothetical protein